MSVYTIVPENGSDAQVWVCLVLIRFPRRQLLCVRQQLVFGDIVPVSMSLPYAPFFEMNLIFSIFN